EQRREDLRRARRRRERDLPAAVRSRQVLVGSAARVVRGGRRARRGRLLRRPRRRRRPARRSRRRMSEGLWVSTEAGELQFWPSFGPGRLFRQNRPGNRGGEGGIRTRGQVLARRSLSKRVPSATRSPLQKHGQGAAHSTQKARLDKLAPVRPAK